MKVQHFGLYPWPNRKLGKNHGSHLFLDAADDPLPWFLCFFISVFALAMLLTGAERVALPWLIWAAAMDCTAAIFGWMNDYDGSGLWMIEWAGRIYGARESMSDQYERVSMSGDDCVDDSGDGPGGPVNDGSSLVFIGAPDGSCASTRRDASSHVRIVGWSSFTLLLSFLFLFCGYWLRADRVLLQLVWSAKS